MKLPVEIEDIIYSYTEQLNRTLVIYELKATVPRKKLTKIKSLFLEITTLNEEMLRNNITPENFTYFQNLSLNVRSKQDHLDVLILELEDLHTVYKNYRKDRQFL